MPENASDSGENEPPTRLYIEGETAEFDGTTEDIVEMARSVGMEAFVYVPTEADQAAAAARLDAQDQAITDLSGTLPQVTLTAEEYERVPDGAVLTCISGKTAVKGTDYIDQDTRFGCIAWGFLDSQLPPTTGRSDG